MQASQAMSSALAGQPLAVKAARTPTARRRQSVLAQAAAPPSAWPGRVALPETHVTRDGPKVRLPFGCGMVCGM